MKLISTLFNKKTLKVLAAALLMLMTTFTYAKMTLTVDVKRVFWNRFDAKVNNNTIELSWVVTEYNNKNFQIEHSLNGNDWEEIALIPSKNSAESLEGYSYTHKNNVEGKHYYRIKHTDIDVQNEGYSPVKIVAVKNEKQTSIVRSNPATGEVCIINNSEGKNLYTKAMIFDLSGKLLMEKNIQPGINTLTINELPSGIYFVRVEGNAGGAYSQKIIKQ
jgi:hypothetical protein